MNRRGIAWQPPSEKTDLTRYRDEPVAFVREVLGADPWQKQEEILQALAREPRVTGRSCNGAGKSVCAAWAVLWFLETRPGSIVVTTAPTGRQVRDLLWRRIRTAFHGARIPLVGRCLTTFIECDTEWYATGFSTDEEVNFQGPHSPHGVLFVGDEASGLAPWLFEAAQGFMTEPGAKTLLIGNPNTPTGAFYDSHQKWPKEQKFHISAFDVPAHVLTPGWKEDCRRDWGEESPAYQVRVLGNFPPQGADSLIALAWVEAAQQRQLPAVGEGVIGCDIARYGSDESVAYVRRGPAVIAADYWRSRDLMETTGRLVALARTFEPARIQVDDIGMGGGVTDRLLELKRAGEIKAAVVPIDVSKAAADPERYANRRAEIHFALAERLKAGTIDLPEEDASLVAQLTNQRYRYTSQGKYQLESKEEMKKRKQPSPDRADALALCFAAPPRPENPLAGIVAQGRAKGWQPQL